MVASSGTAEVSKESSVRLCCPSVPRPTAAPMVPSSAPTAAPVPLADAFTYPSSAAVLGMTARWAGVPGSVPPPSSARPQNRPM